MTQSVFTLAIFSLVFLILAVYIKYIDYLNIYHEIPSWSDLSGHKSSRDFGRSSNYLLTFSLVFFSMSIALWVSVLSDYRWLLKLFLILVGVVNMIFRYTILMTNNNFNKAQEQSFKLLLKINSSDVQSLKGKCFFGLINALAIFFGVLYLMSYFPTN